MSRKYHKRRIVSEINITPFTDVILVLLIIFMVATPLLSQASISVKLPQAASAQSVKNDQEIPITITAESLVYLDQTVVTRKELKEKISKRYSENSDISIQLRIDQSVRFKDVVGVLDILNDLGIRNLNIAALPRS